MFLIFHTHPTSCLPATLATTLGILIWLFSYSIPNSFIYFDYNEWTLAPKLLICLFPNMAMTLGFRVMAMFEGRGEAAEARKDNIQGKGGRTGWVKMKVWEV